MRSIPCPLKTNTFSLYVMLIDDERIELFSVFVPVHTRSNLCESPTQTQFVRHIAKLVTRKNTEHIYWIYLFTSHCQSMSISPIC